MQRASRTSAVICTSGLTGCRHANGLVSGQHQRRNGEGGGSRTFVQQPDWHTFATAVSAAGLAALKAGEAKNSEALLTANGQLVEACEDCHKRFKPSLPSEGITHSHAH